MCPAKIVESAECPFVENVPTNARRPPEYPTSAPTFKHRKSLRSPPLHVSVSSARVSYTFPVTGKLTPGLFYLLESTADPLTPCYSRTIALDDVSFQALVKLFTTPEIIGYPVERQDELEADPCLSAGGPELLEK